MLGDTAAKRRARRAIGPWLLAGVAVWLVLDNGPALFDEWRLRGAAETGTATVVSIGGGRSPRVVRRLWDDVFWGRGRRVTYQFAPGGRRDDRQTSGAAFVTHSAAEGLQQGGAVGVRYAAGDPAVHRIAGEPGLLLLLFRLMMAVGLGALSVFLLRGMRSRSETASASSSLRA